MKTQSWIIILLIAVAVTLGILWISSNAQRNRLAMENDSIRASYEQATNTINEIQGHLDSIEAEAGSALFGGGELPMVAGADRRSQLTRTINNMKLQIQADKKRIAELEKKLAGSNKQMKGLQEMINKLKASVADKEKIVAELSSKLGILSETLESERVLSKEEIARRDKTISEKQEEILTKEKDLNTMYVAFGARKELIDKKIISRQGGVLGLGRVSTLQKSAELEKFNLVNLMETDEITFPLTKKGYSILSNQNPASYKVEKSDNNYVLKVTNKEQFRKNKVVVIEIL